MNDDIKQTPVPAVPAQTGMQSLDWDAVNSAANTANYNFGQWMPERWLQEFVKAYNASIHVQPVQQPAPVAADLAAFNAYFCNTLSCDGVETEQQVEDCRVAAYDAWCEATRRADARAALATPIAAPVAANNPEMPDCSNPVEIDRVKTGQDSGRGAALVEYLIRYKHCMSYNESYFSEPAGKLKRMVYAADRSHPANSARAGELSDEQIKEIIFDCHAEDGMGQELDLTKLCRAILNAAKKGGA